MTSEPSATPSSPAVPFPKARHLLRSKDFRRVYDEGTRVTCPFFAAFYRPEPGLDGPKVGFTTPRALGKAVVRNRLRRRIREAVRLSLANLPAQWMVVFNPRRAALDAPFATLRREVERVFARCKA